MQVTSINMADHHKRILDKIANDQSIGERKPSISSLVAEAIEFWLKSKENYSGTPGPYSQ